MKLTVKIQGQKELLKKFKQFGEDSEKMVSDVTKINAKEIETNAKRLAPVDFGALRQNIVAQKITNLDWRITAFMKYSAFMEFGTGGFVDVPSEFLDIARQFKGKEIRKVNIHPQPFMYPSFVKARGIYPLDLEQGFEVLIKRYNGI